MNDKLEDFRNEVEYNLTFGPLADMDLRVVNDAGEAVVVVALAEEKLSAMVQRINDAGGAVNLFVADDAITHSVSVVPEVSALLNDAVDDMTGDQRPSFNASVGMFIAYLRTQSGGVLLPATISGSPRPKAELTGDVELVHA